MDKIKSLLRPGGSKDDEVLYGSGGSSGSKQTEQPAHLETDPGVDKKDQGVLRQIMNPGGNKYDEIRHGTTAHADRALDQPDTVARDSNLETNPGVDEKKGGVLRQILNPNKNKYDEVQHGTTAQASEPRESNLESSTGGAPQTHDYAAGNVEPAAASSALPTSEEKHAPLSGTMMSRLKDNSARSVSTASLKSGIMGPYADRADEGMPDSGPSNTAAGASLPNRSVQGTSGLGTGSTRDPAAIGQARGERSFPLSGGTTAAADPTSRVGSGDAAPQGTDPADQSHFGRDAALTGAGVAGAGALAHEVRKPHDDTERSFPRSGGTTAGEDPTSRLGSNEAVRPGTDSADQSHLGRDAALAGAGAVGAGTLAHEARKPEDNDRSGPVDGALSGMTGSGVDNSRLGESRSIRAEHIPGDPFGYHKPDEKPAEGYVHHTQGPHATDMANLLDPHVPGEFPAETGEDPHAAHHDQGIGGTGSTTGATSSGPQGDISSGNEHHYGRDAALAGGAGAAGLGAYEAGKDRGVSDTTGSGSQHPTTTTRDTIPPGAANTERELASDPQQQHHYGRDAALAGGAGATGLGGYEALKHRHDDTDLLTSQTSVPQTSTTNQQYGQSSVPPTTAFAQPAEGKHHYGHDAAVAGGTSAAGVAGYEALKDRDTPTSSRNAAPQEMLGSQRYGENVAPRTDIDPKPAEKQHHYGRDAAVAGGAGAAGVAGYEALKDRHEPMSRTAQPQEPLGGQRFGESAAPTTDPRYEPEEKQHHYGRDAAVAGGAGAAGVAGYEALKDRDEPTSRTTQSQGPLEDQRYDRSAAPTTDPAHQTSEKQHHYGRDAAVAGGAGATGLAGYEALKDRDTIDTGPASKTVGPHDSNVANVVDPRVQPQPEKQKQSTTTGPHKSDMANEADPRVTAEPKKAAETKQQAPEEDKHHYDRDAAIAGGSGAAAAGAYEATKSTEEPRPTKQELLDSYNEHHSDKQHHKLEKTPHQVEKHEHELEKAREKEAAKGGDRGSEKKEGFLHRILHPGHKDKHAEENPRHESPAAAAGVGAADSRQRDTLGDDGRVIEPHTGLPMNVQKYGDGRGGTDGSSNIEGYHQPLEPASDADRGDKFVTEPHTGLPMNVGKYGSGEGGTDGSTSIPGYHEHGSGADSRLV